ncbi:MAG: peptide chain release factor N(5)-glutamine methyltransferase [Bacteroidales bacterium]|nr:peptide chain release factor N(5)-glutamine methyltransferase [Bacteroidales bacterium]
MTLFELRKTVLQRLTDAHVDDATTLSRYLICDVMDLTLTQMMMADRDEVDSKTADYILECSARLSNGEPLQYVTHKAFFCGHTFWVEPGVLIPRPETELLVDMASSFIAENGSSRILDIGTGSGCIALSIKANAPKSEVTAIDVSPDAITIARKNASSLGLDVNMLISDVFADTSSLGSFDVVVSNPPYVCHSEKHSMKPNVLLHEPHLALFVPDDDPLLYYRRIARLCKNGLLNAGGALFFEINESFSEQTMQMMMYEGFSDVKRFKDYCGKWRVCTGRL